MTRIIVIEDDPNYRKLLTDLLQTAKDYKVIAAYEACEKALERLKMDLPDIVLMDIDLPGMNGIEGTITVKQLLPETEILMLTMHTSGDKVFGALCAGAVGYLTKHTDLNTLLQSLDEVREGGAPMSADIARMVVKSFSKNHNSPLTGKELEVLTLLSEGKGYKTIGEKLDISVNTVKFHIKNIYSILQVSNKEQALQMARKNKWL